MCGNCLKPLGLFQPGSDSSRQFLLPICVKTSIIFSPDQLPLYVSSGPSVLPTANSKEDIRHYWRGQSTLLKGDTETNQFIYIISGSQRQISTLFNFNCFSTDNMECFASISCRWENSRLFNHQYILACLNERKESLRRWRRWNATLLLCIGDAPIDKEFSPEDET